VTECRGEKWGGVLLHVCDSGGWPLDVNPSPQRSGKKMKKAKKRRRENTNFKWGACNREKKNPTKEGGKTRNARKYLLLHISHVFVTKIYRQTIAWVACRHLESALSPIDETLPRNWNTDHTQSEKNPIITQRRQKK